MDGSPYALRIRPSGSSLVHIAQRHGTGARTPCGFTPGAGYYTVVAAAPVTCPQCLDHVDADPSGPPDRR
ncbi:hypothetical protein GXW82_41370 [Streptacidiphilus sp. 4-A2]|nr:hypothetical protein [Streptacidiphilus sp. 4-A2]